MWSRIRVRSCASASLEKVDDRTTTVLSALASRLTAVCARSLSFHTCAAVNATKRPKMMPRGGNKPRDTALRERPLSLPARSGGRKRRAKHDDGHPSQGEL